MQPLTSSIIVLEGRPRWTPELERQCPPSAVADVRVLECRTTTDVARRVRETGGGPVVVVMQLDASPAACLQFLARRLNGPERIPVIGLGSNAADPLEWLARDLGMNEYLNIDVPGEDLARICRKYLELQTP